MFFNKSKENIFEKYIIENKEKAYKVSFIYLKNKENALEVVQESVVKAYSKLNTLKDMNALDKWFTRILVNTALDFIRKNSKTIASEEEVIEVLINKDIEKESSFNEIIENLDEDLKGVIVLKYFDGYKIKEISEILNISESQIKNKIHKALNILRKEIKEEV